MDNTEHLKIFYEETSLEEHNKNLVLPYLFTKLKFTKRNMQPKSFL